MFDASGRLVIPPGCPVFVAPPGTAPGGPGWVQAGVTVGGVFEEAHDDDGGAGTD